MSRKSKSRKFGVTANALAPTPGTAPHKAPRPGARPSPHWGLELLPVLIAFFTVAAFLPTLQNQFVNWDDHKNLLDNPHYRGLGWPQLSWMWTTFHMGHYNPLTWMTFGLDYLLWGMQPLGYHLTSLLLHVANAVVFYFVACRVLALRGPAEPGNLGLAVAAAFAALFFALHPLRVESVAWVTERRDVLSGLFYLLTILVYLRGCERGERGRGWYWGAVGLCACALLSKSMAVSLPVILLILDVYPLRRLGGTTGWWRAAARRVYLEKLPFGVLAASASAIAFLALFRLNNMAPPDQLTMSGRLAVSAYGLSFYLWKMIAPVNLSPLYELSDKVNPWAIPFVLSYAVIVAVTALVWALRRLGPGLAAAWVTYVVILLPVLGIIQNGPQIAADRYTYLGGLGWAILAGAGLGSGWRRWPSLSTALALFLLLSLGAITWNQVRIWHDSETLWTHALAADPKSSIAENNLGVEIANQGKQAEAIEHHRRALAIRPTYAEAHYNWGLALARQGRPAEAMEHYQQALRFKPEFSDAHNNWGVALAQQGRLAEAVEHYQQALRLKPDNAEAHYNWGLALARQGRPAEAMEHYQQALRFKPDYSNAHNNWGMALTQQGRLAEAVEHYQQALRLKPDHAEAHYNWGLALIQQGKMLEAIDHLKQAMNIMPEESRAQFDLLDALLRRGIGEGADASSRKGKRAE